jgi:rhodanese-related sulfurtransferase
MKNNRNYILNVFLAVITLFLPGCLKDDVNPVNNISLSNNALLLNYLETNGDYINSREMPSIADVDEVYNNLENYLIIDVRSEANYSSGHISGAINIQNDSLVQHLNSLSNISQYPKIIIVSNDGQASAYYTSLLRIYGFSNVYSLNFGMALWNSAFSNNWIMHAKNHEIQYHLDGNIHYPGDPDMKLPDIKAEIQNGNKQDNIKSLITEIIKEGFNSQTYVNLSPPDTVVTTNENDQQVTIFYFYFDNEAISDFYIISFGSTRLYHSLAIFPYPTGHIPGAHLYYSRDLQSSTFLQALPTDGKIVIYSVSGQISAFIVAYLRLLGYNAKSLLYGANGYTYSRLVYDKDFFTPYVFLSGNIRNYPYVTGSSPK